MSGPSIVLSQKRQVGDCGRKVQAESEDSDDDGLTGSLTAVPRLEATRQISGIDDGGLGVALVDDRGAVSRGQSTGQWRTDCVVQSGDRRYCIGVQPHAGPHVSNEGLCAAGIARKMKMADGWTGGGRVAALLNVSDMCVCGRVVLATSRAIAAISRCGKTGKTTACLWAAARR